MSLEYITLQKCISQLESALKSDINNFARYLFDMEFITDKIYEEVLEPRRSYTQADQAAKLMQHVKRKVENEPSNYYKLINHLRQIKEKYTDIVAVLDAEYFGIRAFPASTGVYCTRNAAAHTTKTVWLN